MRDGVQEMMQEDVKDRGLSREMTVIASPCLHGFLNNEGYDG